METDPAYKASGSHTQGNVQGNATKPPKIRRNAKAQTVVKMSGNNGQTREVYQQQVKNIDEVKSRSEPQKKPQVFAAVSVSTGCLSYGICMAYTSSAIPSMMEPNSALNITANEASWMSSLLALGALFGSLSAVFLMDAVGRKASLLAFSVMSLFIGWTLLMAASQAWQLYVGRFLLGLGAGLEITISPVYIHETTRADLRDICGSFPQVMTALGIVICYFMGRSLAWNWLSIAALIFLIPFTFGLYYIPESPPWLVYNDEEDLAFRSMSQIRGDDYDATKEIGHIKEILALHKNDLQALVALDNDIQDEAPEKFQFRDIFNKSVLHPFLVILVLMFLLQFSGQGAITFYTVQIFKDACSVVNPKNCALIIGLTYFVSAILSLILKNLIGRRILMLISSLGMAVSQIALGAYFYFLAQQISENSEFCKYVDVINTNLSEHNVTIHEPLQDLVNISWVPLPLLMVFTVAFNLGLGSLTWVVATEVLPVRSRGWTQTIANVTSNFCWFLVTKTFKDIQDELGLSAPFFFYGSVCIFGFFFIYIFLPETRGKSYEETAQSFEGVDPFKDRIGCPLLSECVTENLEKRIPS